MKSLLLLSVPWVWFVGSVLGQNRSLDLARACESDGDFEKALAIYEDLYHRDSTNLVVTDRLKYTYRILGKNDQRIPILRRQLLTDSSNTVWWIELADAYFRSKQIRQAEYAVNEALRREGQSLTVYRNVAGMMIENRWFEPVEGVYLQARQRFNDSHLFTLELASLYTYRGDAYRAAQSYLQHLGHRPDALDYVRNQVLLLPKDDSSYVAVVRALSEALSAGKENQSVRRLMIDVHFQHRDFDRAFDQCVLADRIQGKGGVEILNFADLTFQNQMYPVALKAYRHFLAEYPNAPQAEMGVARCFERMEVGLDSSAMESVLGDTATVREKYFSTQAVESYRRIVSKYRRTEWSAEAYFRIGNIQFERFFDVDEAVVNYQNALTEYPSASFRHDVLFSIAECMLVQGRMEDVHRKVEAIQRESRSVEVSDRAAFFLGELFFFEESFDSSKAVFGRLAQRKDGLFVNDALRYALLLQESSAERERLAVYARALLMARQHKTAEAQLHLTTLARQLQEESPLFDDVLFQSARLLITQGKFEEAVRVLEGLRRNLPQSPMADLSLKMVAEIHDMHLRDYPKATALYREFLMRFPKSIYGDEVRKRLRRLEQVQKRSS